VSPDPHLVALLGLPQLGPRRLRRLLGAFDEPAAAWAAVRAGRLDDVPLYVKADDRPALVRMWSATAMSVCIDDIAEAHASHGVAVLHPGDEDWPEAFHGDPEPPLLLFARGDVALLSAPLVGIVGTRRCTAAGAATARELGYDLAAAGVGTVSGLALGIDGAGHLGCLEGGGPTVGVVATGLDVVYPRRHAALWERVATEGVLISEAPLGTPAERWRFPARNRLIAALALAVVVVESRRRGGSMLTVESAIERQTDVLAVPGSVRSGASEGPNQLLAEGAPVVRDATDVLVALGTAAPLPTRGRRHPEDGATAPDDVDQGEVDGDDPVHQAVSWPASSLDDIVAATGMPFTEVAARLATLELSGAIERVSDGYRRRVP
jgi:DNA processing protein